MENLIIVRGGGDLATGTIYKLIQCGYKVLVLEVANPSCIRRTVSFCEAIYDKEKTVEGVTCYYASTKEDALNLLNDNKLVLMIDPQGKMIPKFQPIAVVDAIIAKKNLGTNKNMAPITIALGPGFVVGKDCDAVIETKRGHQLGRVIYEGEAIKNTGIPGMIAGYGKERVIHAPVSGTIRHVKHLTDQVEKGEVICYIDDTPVEASLTGLLRGLIREGYQVPVGFKIADIDPRIDEYENCFTISDKARAIAGGVIEALLHLSKKS